jgi:hypothetical protein
MASNTAIRAQRYRACWVEASPVRGGRYAARRARTAHYRTDDGMTRELLRPVVD